MYVTKFKTQGRGKWEQNGTLITNKHKKQN